MSDKFIPRADLDFKMMAMNFVEVIAKDPAKFHISQDDFEAMVSALEEFKAALQANYSPSTRNLLTTQAKTQSRTKLEDIIRRTAQMIRANSKIDSVAKLSLRIKERAARSKKIACPMEAPKLMFKRALHHGNATSPMHELAFVAIDENDNYHKAKPDGATRLELFVDLIPPDAEIPNNPGATPSGRPWYLRSYTKSPIVIEPPMARVPMRVVYWARWADSAGNVGPFSPTVVGWIEGGNVSRPGYVLGMGKPRQKPMISVDAPKQLLDESTYSVAVIEAHYLTVNTQVMREENPKPNHPQLEVTVIKETKQIEGPVEEAA